MKIITDNRDRWITGVALLLVVIGVGVVNNYTLTWGFLGIFYIIGLERLLKLYKMGK